MNINKEKIAELELKLFDMYNNGEEYDKKILQQLAEEWGAFCEIAHIRFVPVGKFEWKDGELIPLDDEGMYIEYSVWSPIYYNSIHRCERPGDLSMLADDTMRG